MFEISNNHLSAKEEAPKTFMRCYSQFLEEMVVRREPKPWNKTISIPSLALCVGFGIHTFSFCAPSFLTCKNVIK